MSAAHGSAYFRGALRTAGLLSSLDATVTKSGRVVVAFTDGCCDQPGGTANYSAIAAVARQQSGRGLFAAYDSTGFIPGN